VPTGGAPPTGVSHDYLADPARLSVDGRPVVFMIQLGAGSPITAMTRLVGDGALRRMLRPLTAANQPQAPPALRQALATIDHHVDDYIAPTRLTPAA
jgi:hypothetical protein